MSTIKFTNITVEFTERSGVVETMRLCMPMETVHTGLRAWTKGELPLEAYRNKQLNGNVDGKVYLGIDAGKNAIVLINKDFDGVLVE